MTELDHIERLLEEIQEIIEDPLFRMDDFSKNLKIKRVVGQLDEVRDTLESIAEEF